MAKPKIGDRVRVVRPIDGNKETVSKAGTIIGINEEYHRICVELDVYIKDHLGTRCWWCDEDDVKVICDKKVVITVNGRTTKAKLYDGKKVVSKSVAKCLADDEFDFFTGAKIAFDRLIADNTKTPEPETDEIKVGDAVKVIDTGAGCSTAIGFVTNNVKDQRLIARYAFSDDLGYCSGVKSLDETFQVIATDGIKAYITENIDSDWSPCYVVDITGLKKIKKEG